VIPVMNELFGPHPSLADSDDMGVGGCWKSVRVNIVVVMPAYNAAATVERTVADLDRTNVSEIILVDDASTDRTVEVARGLGLRVIKHARNTGYGGNQKTCYRAALETDADVIVMVHPDYQYDGRVIGVMAQIIGYGICDIVLGNRMRARREALDGGMPVWKYVINRSSTFFENLVLGQTLGDWHSGLRAYSRAALETIPFERNSDDFGFDQELLIQAVHFGLVLGDVPVPVRYFPEASSINWKRSMRYGADALSAMGSRWMHKARVREDVRFERASVHPMSHRVTRSPKFPPGG